MAVFTLGEATALALDQFGDRFGSARVASASARRPHRTDAPVRRGSIEAGTFEDMFFVAPAKGEADRMLRAARAALDAGRRLKRLLRVEPRDLTPPERALVALTAGAVRVYEEICTLARLNGGRVFPSYDRLAQATALGRATVARALALLEAAGFLIRQRRFKRVEEPGDAPGAERGAEKGGAVRPRYAQTSNVYRPMFPKALMAHLPRWLRPAPLPDDVIQRAAEREADMAAMQASLSARELATTMVGGALGRMLARLGVAVDAAECESQTNPQPLMKSHMNRTTEVDLDGRRAKPNGRTI